ncbi:MAG: alpha/beta hydrolase [Roseofilum sp. SBFL]|uniref:alpha/beta hydrolase n=1 Tax=unclassified Roseofilum TaxID=2620099 RepID=UPI001B0B998D|nr:MULTISPECIES: alpha/beta hydrolase [unclassified Roseofilum]MBP0013076.1 alpha/beta hydrolase [Roseofilum sp. SID3]MBP0025779.1 alpha/beta hydrolase [Roseofilum sp. SID2]MBP0038585.1 alpha/beta hydrolase [Roseofilum sp. SID1]MBP0042428.1 alpha/beta hydrolase [Roseofilum sp. SBFL]
MKTQRLKTLLIGKFSLFRLLRSAIAIYTILCIYIFAIADSRIFLPPDTTYQTLPQSVTLTSEPGINITSQYLPNPNATYTLLYSHGNAEDLGMIQPVLEHLNQLGFSVFAYDYRGYGTSEGKPTERGAYQDIRAAYTYLTETLKIPPSQIVLYGRSVGGGPSIDLATQTAIAALVTENTFISVLRIVTWIPLFPFDKFNNIGKINKISAPVLIFHATLDRVIPLSHGQELYQVANAPKMLVPIEGLGHNDWMGRVDLYNHNLQEVSRGQAIPI